MGFFESTNTRVEHFRKQINISFKKASYISSTTPTEYVENFLYGMSFYDYMKFRILRFCKSQVEINNPIFQAVTRVRGKYRPNRGQAIGKLLRKYCELLNE